MRPAAALVSLHVAVALFGVAGLFGAWIDLGPVAIVLGRTLVAALALCALALATRTFAPPTAGLALNGLVLAAHWVSFFAAIKAASVAVGLIGYASFPLFTLLLEAMAGERRGTRLDVGVAALVVVGLLLTVPRFERDEPVLLGLAWGLVSGATFAWLAVRNRGLTRSHAARAIALWQNVFAAACLLPLAVLADRPSWPTARDLAMLVVLGIACTALAHTLFVASLGTLSAHTASVVAALEPAYGIALAAALLGERPTPGMLVGAALLVIAALVASRKAVAQASPGRMPP
jgi:drug/metabolite transporter (DMT)-like permease